VEQEPLDSGSRGT